MRVLVVNAPELAGAIDRLRGEWESRSGGSLSATTKSWDEVAKSQSADADLIIFPSRYLGELCVRGKLRPVRRNVLDGETYDAADVLPLARHELVTWGGQTMALPLAVDLPTDGFLVAAAPTIVSPDTIGPLFDPETMKPRIAEQPFVNALAQMKRPSAAEVTDTVPVLGNRDLLIGVAASSRNAASAFQLLEWLSSSEMGSQLASATGGKLPVRRTQLSSSERYDAKLGAEELAQLRSRIERLLKADRYLMVPRIPGIDRYLSALDEAVQSATAEQFEPSVALEKASAKWEAITDELGRESQRKAYAKHLGIDAN